MKKIINSLFFIGFVTVLFASCKKEQLAKPATATQEASAITSAANASSSLLSAAPTYTLTRRGKDTLAYYSDGRLARVLHGAGLYTQYNYGFNAVIAKKYSRLNNQLKEETIYLVDAQMGRVYEAKNKVYSYNNNGAIVVTKTFKYEYDANGYLKMKFNKDIPMERTMFNWTSVDNDLVSVVFYNQKGEQSALVAFSRYPKEDKLRLHSNRSQLDPYLKIFGKGPKKMTGNELVYEGPDNQLTGKELFNYLYNADGYPTGCQATNQLTNEHIAIIEYGYSVSRNK
jgi:hypothetical protein